ncbi:MAG: type IV toxin-antitoxin system AbiEi family antitoxin [Saprospiraceae bacterium]|nr:type IV toxin-antitoxin system AbiEi family antitoxin [Saprospiraceae bacterium]
MIIKPTYKYLEDYLAEIQSKGRYSVTLGELKAKFNTSEKAILQNIYRLKSKNHLAQVRKEFYVTISPQYSNRGIIPPTFFIDDMMKFLNRDYYVCLHSAAALHGAGHQQPMEFQVMIKKPPLRNIVSKKLIISFFTKGQWEQEQIVEKKTECGYINVSTPELTGFDLILHNKKVGGLNRIIPIIEDLTESMKPSLIATAAKSQMTPTIQRFGYLLDEMGKHLLANSLNKSLKNHTLKEIPLSLMHNNRTGKTNEKWKIIINTKLDV